MLFIDANQVRSNINEAAKKGVPFFFSIDYEMSEGIFVENPMEQNDILFSFNGITNKPKNEVNKKPETLQTNPLSEEEYKEKFDIVQKGLQNGEINVINLTARTPINTNISIRDIFMRSKSKYQIYVPERFVCFSPERFVKIENGIISSNPMKGTIDASIPNAEEIILTDPKELSEHTATAKWVVQELSAVSSNTHIERFRYIDLIESKDRNLLQVSSEITGELPDDYKYHMGDIIFSLLPAASITGAPKAKTMEYIKLAEKEKRGYYCGIAGYFDGTTLDSAVLIRFIEMKNGKMFYRSGGGVTKYSICSKEYKEVIAKIYLPIE